MKKTISVLAIGVLASTSVIAGDINVTADVSSRVISKDSQEVQQNKVVLKFQKNFDNGWVLVGVGQNGGSYSGDYDTMYNSGNKDDEFDQAKDLVDNFSFRKLYVKKKIANPICEDCDAEIQAGALETEPGMASVTGLSKAGWVDGVRLKAETPYGEVTVTAGSIGDLEETNFYSRDYENEYLEVKITKQVFENLVAEFGGERYDGDTYYKIAGDYSLELAADQVISIIAETLVNTDDDTEMSSIGIRGDFIKMLTGESSGLSFELRDNHMDAGMSSRASQMTNEFSASEGHSGSFTVKGKIKGNQKLQWYVRVRHNYDTNENRYETGIDYKYGAKK